MALISFNHQVQLVSECQQCKSTSVQNWACWCIGTKNINIARLNCWRVMQTLHMFNLLEFDVKFLIEWQAWLTLWIMSQLIIYLYELMIVFGSAWWMFLGRKFLSSHTHTIPKQKFIYCKLGTIFPYVWSIRSIWFLIFFYFFSKFHLVTSLFSLLVFDLLIVKAILFI